MCALAGITIVDPLDSRVTGCRWRRHDRLDFFLISSYPSTQITRVRSNTVEAMARPLSAACFDIPSVFRSSSTLSPSYLSRSSNAWKRRKISTPCALQQKREYLGQAQRRRATTSSVASSFQHPVIDHHYEYESGSGPVTEGY